MEGNFVLLQVDKEICYEGQSLLFHESVHIFLADFNACDIDALHLKIINKTDPKTSSKLQFKY